MHQKPIYNNNDNNNNNNNNNIIIIIIIIIINVNVNIITNDALGPWLGPSSQGQRKPSL